MTPTTMRETLKHQLDTWPDELVEYVFDFVQFVAQDQQAEEVFLWQKVEEAQAYDQQHPEEIKTVTAEDWDSMFQHETNTSS
jgi:hemerythrin superfamily protein